MMTNDDRNFRCPACRSWRWRASDPCPTCGLGDAVPATAGDLAPLRRPLPGLAQDEAIETTEDICRELRAAGLDPERMQRRVRDLLERVRTERGMGGASLTGPLGGAEVAR